MSRPPPAAPVVDATATTSTPDAPGSRSAARVIGSRLVPYAVVGAVVVLLNFLLPRALPGGPLAAIAGESVGDLSAQERSELIAEYGLDRPLLGQFLTYLGDLVRGDLGASFVDGEPVATKIAGALPWTLLLVGTAIAVTTLLGIAIGARAGILRARGRGTGVVATVLLLDAMPAFWLGMLLIVGLGVQLDLLPIFGAESIGNDLHGWARVLDIVAHLVLPVTTLVLTGMAQLVLVVRASMVAVLGSEHLEQARARGFSPHRLAGHALRDALLPAHTVLLLDIGYLVGGALVVETVFAYPGIGRLTFDALQGKDYPVMQGTFLVLSGSVLLANVIADLTYPLLDPRARVGSVSR